MLWKLFGVKDNNVILTNPFVLIGDAFGALPCMQYQAIIRKKKFFTYKNIFFKYH